MSRVWRRFLHKLWQKFLEKLWPEIRWFFVFVVGLVFLPFVGICYFWSWMGVPVPENVFAAIITYIFGLMFFWIFQGIYNRAKKVYIEATKEIHQENRELIGMIDD